MLFLAIVAAAIAALGSALPAASPELPQSPPKDYEGFHIHPTMPDGNYRIHVDKDTQKHLVKRWSPHTKRWHSLEKRQGTGEYTFLVDDADGRVHHVSSDVHPPTRVPVPVDETQCTHYWEYHTLNDSLIQSDYWASKQAFFNWCKFYPILEGHIELALNGNVAVYVCQRRVTTLFRNFCSEAEYKDSERYMNETCGESSAWAWIPKWNKQYGRAWRGEYVCDVWGEIEKLNVITGVHKDLKKVE